jgi:MerR family transcriptional regulator, mercuric resistance operon regulatory protein
MVEQLQEQGLFMRALTEPRLEPLSIGELSKLSRVGIDAIRYYEKIKLLRAPTRSPQGRRFYAASDVPILVFIRRARELGFTIDQIRVFLKSGAPDNARCEEIQKLASLHIDSIRARITQLSKAEAVLVRALAQCSGDATRTCPIADFLMDDVKENGR